MASMLRRCIVGGRKIYWLLKVWMGLSGKTKETQGLGECYGRLCNSDGGCYEPLRYFAHESSAVPIS
jgi:hypothetical protein